MNKSLIYLGFALAVAGCAHENDTAAQKAAVMRGMMDKPAGTYAFVPYTRAGAENNTYTGKFDLLVKKNDYTTPETVDERGRRGTTFCANFDVYQTQLKSDGKMGLPYKQQKPDSSAGSSSYIYDPIDNTKEDALLNPKGNITLENDRTFKLEVKVEQLCDFTPKAP